jgi:hypothetical protein
MSLTIPRAHVEAFNRRILHLAQQKMSKLRGTLLEEPVTGKQGNAERLGKAEMVQQTSRHADTPLVDVEHSRRRIPILDWGIGDLVDDSDRLKTIINATSGYARTFAMAAGRKMDERILFELNSAATQDGDGNAVAFDTGNNPTMDLDLGATAPTLAIVLEAITALRDNGADDTEGFHIAVEGNWMKNWLDVEEVGSADYNSIKALVSGQLNTFLGFTWHILVPGIIPEAADGDKYAMFWSEFGGMIGMQQDVRTRISERNDKRHSTQVYTDLFFGVARTDEARVGRIRYDNTV